MEKSQFMNKIKFYFFIFLFTCFFSSVLYAEKNYFAEGEGFFLKKNLAKSKFKFEKDIVFNPKNEKSYLYLAKIYKLENNDKFQEQNLNTDILLDPKNEEGLYLLTLLKLKQSDYERSKELIKIFTKVCKNLCKKESELREKFKNLK